MIIADFSKNETDNIIAFTISGHAEYGDYGKDIVCSAVSALTFSTINNINRFLEINFQLDIKETEEGYLSASFNEKSSDKDLQLLLKHLYFGLEGIEEEYSKYIKLNMNRE